MSHPSLSKPPPYGPSVLSARCPGLAGDPAPRTGTRAAHARPLAPRDTHRAATCPAPPAGQPSRHPRPCGDGPVAGSAGGSRLSPARRVPHSLSSPAAAPAQRAAPRRDAHGAAGRLRGSFTTTQNSHRPTPGCRTALTPLADVSSVRPRCGGFAAEMQRVGISCARWCEFHPLGTAQHTAPGHRGHRSRWRGTRSLSPPGGHGDHAAAHGERRWPDPTQSTNRHPGQQVSTGTFPTAPEPRHLLLQHRWRPAGRHRNEPPLRRTGVTAHSVSRTAGRAASSVPHTETHPATLLPSSAI